MDYYKYRLITEDENEELFSLQSAILSLNTMTEAEKVLKLSMLLMRNPIQDHETAISLLNDFSLTEVNLHVLIIGAEIDGVCPILQPNPFIKRLKVVYPNCSLYEKSIITYLEAIDIENSLNVQNEKVLKVEQLLKESIDLCSDYVNNYYRLALLSNRRTAKKLMKKALSNVILIKPTDEQMNESVTQSLTFKQYLNEHITGTHISVNQFNILKNYYYSL